MPLLKLKKVVVMGKNWKLSSISNYILLLTGIWLVLGSFLLNYSSAPAQNTDFFTGLLIILLSLSAIILAHNRFSPASWLAGIVGLWLVSAPFVLSYSGTTAALVNDTVFGLVAIAVSLWQILLAPEESEIIMRHFSTKTFERRYASELKRKPAPKKKS